MATRPVNQYEPDEVSHPGETLRELLDERHIHQSTLAARTGRPEKTISEIINGKAAITAETALQLEFALGMPAPFWLARQRNYDEWLARQEQAAQMEAHKGWVRQFPTKDMKRWGLLPEQAEGLGLLRSLLSFFNIASPAQWEPVYTTLRVSFRHTPRYRSDPAALAAWLHAGVRRAEAIECAPYDQQRFREVLRQARALTTETPERFCPVLNALCAQAGVALVLVPEMKGVRVSGASRWLGPSKALIQLSLRYKSSDQLWFTFFHEAFHVLSQQRKAVFLDDPGRGPDAADEDARANKWAADFLIPPAAFAQLRMQAPFSDVKIREAAAQLGISPGIVAGRLHHERLLRFDRGQHLKDRYQWNTP
ncbi:MAG: HigA family addiction module antitoxin [Candidatus Latescibacterota bacterium]